jgi:hypothetical protein
MDGSGCCCAFRLLLELLLLLLLSCCVKASFPGAQRLLISDRCRPHCCINVTLNRSNNTTFSRKVILRGHSGLLHRMLVSSIRLRGRLTSSTSPELQPGVEHW